MRTLVLIFLVGLVIGFLATAYIDKEEIQLIRSPRNFWQTFVNHFTLNYWYFFLTWMMGLVIFGFILVFFICFLKGFFEGIVLGIFVRSQAFVGIIGFLKMRLWDVILLIPLFLYLCYLASENAMQKMEFGDKKISYFNQLVMITIGLVIYCSLKCISKWLVEV